MFRGKCLGLLQMGRTVGLTRDGCPEKHSVQTLLTSQLWAFLPRGLKDKELAAATATRVITVNFLRRQVYHKGLGF